MNVQTRSRLIWFSCLPNSGSDGFPPMNFKQRLAASARSALKEHAASTTRTLPRCFFKQVRVNQDNWWGRNKEQAIYLAV